MPTRVLTWNLQGREGPDLDGVAEVLRSCRADVVALQEVQPGQAAGIARRLSWWHAWHFKHWPVVVPPEGSALLAAEPLADVRGTRLASAPPWSSRRRIAVSGTVHAEDGPLRVVGVHLGAGVGDDERARQARGTLDVLGTTGCVVGDLNTKPGSPVLATYADAGLRDAWAEIRPGEPGPTNWRPGPRQDPPTQRLDYVLVTADVEVVAVELPAHGEPGFERFGALSDHLPLLAELRRR